MARSFVDSRGVLWEVEDALSANGDARCLRFNTVVCKPEHVALLGDGRAETLRLIFAEHGLRLQIDAMSPWPSLTVLWIDPAPAQQGEPESR